MITLAQWLACNFLVTKRIIIVIVFQSFYFRLDGFTDTLSQEISLEFTRSMNKILFDKTVTSTPSLFPFVTLPEPEDRPVPETG